MNLSEMAAACGGAAIPDTPIPLWEFLEREESPQWTLFWKRPDVVQLSYIAKNVQTLATLYPAWPDDLRYNVALMAQCHVRGANDALPPLDFYAGIVAGRPGTKSAPAILPNDALYWWLLDRLVRSFPEICLPETVLNLACLDNDFARKIGFEGTLGLRMETVIRLGELTVKHLHRWVEECREMPIERIADLEAAEQELSALESGRNTTLSAITQIIEGLTAKHLS